MHLNLLLTGASMSQSMLSVCLLGWLCAGCEQSRTLSATSASSRSLYFPLTNTHTRLQFHTSTQRVQQWTARSLMKRHTPLPSFLLCFVMFRLCINQSPHLDFFLFYYQCIFLFFLLQIFKILLFKLLLEWEWKFRNPSTKTQQATSKAEGLSKYRVSNSLLSREELRTF